MGDKVRDCGNCARLTTAPSRLARSGWKWVCNLGLVTGNIDCEQFKCIPIPQGKDSLTD